MNLLAEIDQLEASLRELRAKVEATLEAEGELTRPISAKTLTAGATNRSPRGKPQQGLGLCKNISSLVCNARAALRKWVKYDQRQYRTWLLVLGPNVSPARRSSILRRAAKMLQGGCQVQVLSTHLQDLDGQTCRQGCPLGKRQAPLTSPLPEAKDGASSRSASRPAPSPDQPIAGTACRSSRPYIPRHP